MPISNYKRIYSFEHEDAKYSDDQDIGYLVTMPYCAGEKNLYRK